MKQLAAIALGSNLDSAWGGREATLREAIVRLGALGTVTAVSSFHDTEPVGYLDQPRFLNAALLLETAMEPLELMRALLAIEQGMGRDRSVVIAKGPRLIDLDLLLFDDQVIRSPELIVPHPELARRRFVLEPLSEIAPDMLDPRSGLAVKDLLSRLFLGNAP